VTTSFSKYLPWQAMHFLQRSTHFSKTCCKLLITSKFLTSELPFHGWKSPEEIAWGETELNSVFGLEKVDRWNPIRTSAIQSSSWTGGSAPLLCRGRHNIVTVAHWRQSTKFSNGPRIFNIPMPKHYAIQTYEGVERQTFRSERSASDSGRFPPR
jgi:hypothetical protein